MSAGRGRQRSQPDNRGGVKPMPKTKQVIKVSMDQTVKTKLDWLKENGQYPSNSAVVEEALEYLYNSRRESRQTAPDDFIRRSNLSPDDFEETVY